MHRFSLDQLETLLALIDTGSFETAASRLHVTPSAVSQRVKAMEQASGRVLVRRTSPVTLTEDGDVLLRYARQVDLLEVETLRTLRVDSGSGGPFRVSLAVNADSLATWFLEALAGLGERLGVVFDLHREDQEHTATLLRAGTVIAAVTSTRDAVQGCVIEPLGIMRYRAVATPAFRDRWMPGPATPTQLADAPVVTFDRNDALQEAFLRAYSTGGSSATHYVPTSADFARAITLEFGWGLLPEQQCLGSISEGVLVELAPGHPVDVPLFWQRWNLASPLLDAVSAAVRGEAARALRRVEPPARLASGFA
ncbi:MAG: LysR family transcriptional regulator ArgP [Actinomycetota bacterium]